MHRRSKLGNGGTYFVSEAYSDAEEDSADDEHPLLLGGATNDGAGDEEAGRHGDSGLAAQHGASLGREEARDQGC